MSDKVVMPKQLTNEMISKAIGASILVGDWAIPFDTARVVYAKAVELFGEEPKSKVNLTITDYEKRLMDEFRIAALQGLLACSNNANITLNDIAERTERVSRLAMEARNK